MGDGEVVESSCLLLLVAQLAPDGQAALLVPQSRLVFALLVQQKPEPVGQQASPAIRIRPNA
jgi:hypothetical protein